MQLPSTFILHNKTRPYATERRVWVIKRRWNANDRRAEIIRILSSNGHETMSNLASWFNVSRRTICYDIELLTASHPIETARGRYGCVKLLNGYGKYQNHLSQDEQNILLEMALDLSCDRYRQAVIKILHRLGSKSNQNRISNLL